MLPRKVFVALWSFWLSVVFRLVDSSLVLSACWKARIHFSHCLSIRVDPLPPFVALQHVSGKTNFFSGCSLYFLVLQYNISQHIVVCMYGVSYAPNKRADLLYLFFVLVVPVGNLARRTLNSEGEGEGKRERERERKGGATSAATAAADRRFLISIHRRSSRRSSTCRNSPRLHRAW